MCVVVTQKCPTLCNSMDCSPPGSSGHGILQARIWSGLPFPSPGDLPEPGIEPRSPALQAMLCCLGHQGSLITFIGKEKKSESCSIMSDSAIPWTVAYHSLSMDSPGKNTGVGCHSFSRGSSRPRDQTWVSALQADSLPSEPLGSHLHLQYWERELTFIEHLLYARHCK